MQQLHARSSPAAAAAGGAASLLTPIGYRCNDCGYCKAEDSSQRTPNSRASYYIRTQALRPEHYQELVDRGWRRSGALLYLPDPTRSCCPHYAIRLPAAQFKPTRDHRQTLHRWNRHVLGERYSQERAAKYPQTKEEKKRAQTSFDLVQAVHEAEVSTLKAGLAPEHQFEVCLEPATFSDEKYRLFHDYQQHVHHEDDSSISRSGFKRFLCESPLHTHVDGKGKQLGSFHQCYRLDGRLIAMGVLDLLPHAVSGVYFIYHHDFETWSFGKLSALREAALALEMQYDYYYMGYYIHSCKKMRYKADYKPQCVLDFDSGAWDSLDEEMSALMAQQRYVSMSRERQKRALERSRSPAQNDRRTPASPPEVAGSHEESPRPRDPDGDHDLPYPNPVAAMESGLSLFDLHMPGIPPLERLQQDVDLARMKIYAGPRVGVHEAQALYTWGPGSYTDTGTLKGLLAEMAAAIGPTIARAALVDLSR